MYRIGNWINQGSGWIAESIERFYLNVRSHSPLIGRIYIELLDELKNSRKRLINTQNDDNKCFFWCHIRHLNLIDKNPQRIIKKDKELISKLNYEGINFPVSKKGYDKIGMQNKICINVFCYENKVVYPVYLSDQKISDSMDLLLISDKFKSHYVILKILTDLCSIKQNTRVKNTFVRIVYSVLVLKRF